MDASGIPAVGSNCFAGYRLSATMPMTQSVSLPRGSLTVRIRPTACIAIAVVSLMGFGGWVAEADAATKTRSSTTSVRKQTARKAKPKPHVAPKRRTIRARAIARSRLARARAARARQQWLELQTPRYETDESGALVPDVRAAAAII